METLKWQTEKFSRVGKPASWRAAASTILDYWIAFQASILGATIFTVRIGHIYLADLFFYVMRISSVAVHLKFWSVLQESIYTCFTYPHKSVLGKTS